MIDALARFVAALRAERHPVSPAEVVDASRALELVGITRREDVKAALSATLAKDRRATEAFDRLFDRFFAVPRFPADGKGGGRVAAAGERPRPGDGERPSGKPTKPKPNEALKPRREPASRRKAESQDLKELLTRTRHAGERRDGRLRRVHLRHAPADASDPVRRELARRMTTEEEREIAREVPRVLSALKLRIGRRQAAARVGRPWLRRVLRENLSRGGVPFVIPYRAPKRKTTRVVLLVDVSFSVARASGLFLLMAAAFLALGRRARVLAFVDRPVDATEAVLRWVRGRAAHRGGRPKNASRGAARPGDGIVSDNASFAEVLDGLSGVNLTAPSDYGTAFYALRSSRVRPRGRDTVLVVLGDGRTNRFDPLAWALADLARGVKAVLWLVPEPAVRWGTADSALPSYLPSVDLAVEATDLAGLGRGLAELVKRL
jgi:uncharacterized protein with von Willebrand factor type A (vWA) domain